MAPFQRPWQRLSWDLGALVRRPALRWLGSRALHEAVLVVLLGALVFTYRLLGLEQVEIGGDALKVWEFARQLVHGAGVPAELNHHIARFGLVVPVVVAQLALGSNAWVYYAAPLAASVVLHLCVYGIARKVSGRFGGVLSVLLLLSFSPMVRPSSQILPELFGPTYAAAAFLAALFYTEAASPRARRAWLWLTALLLFGAYGSKVSYLYFAPGAALLVWKGRRLPAAQPAAAQPAAAASQPAPASAEATPSRARRVREPVLRLWRWLGRRGLSDALSLTGMVVGLIAIEVFFYIVFTRHTSQLDVISETHGVSHTSRVKEAADFFRIFKTAGAEWHRWLGLGLLASLGLSATARDKRAPLVVGGLLTYLFLHTFVLRKLSPPIPWTHPHPRYLLAIAPLLMVVIGAFVHEALAGIATRSGRLSSPLGRGLLSTVVIGALLLSCVSDLRDDWEKRWNKRHAFYRTQQFQSSLTNAFAQGIPIVTKARGGKPLRAAGSLYIEPHLLIVDGELRGYRAFQSRATKKMLYLAPEVGQPGAPRKALNRDVARRIRKRHCVVELGQRYRFMTGSLKVPKGCAPLLAPSAVPPSAVSSTAVPPSDRRAAGGAKTKQAKPASAPTQDDAATTTVATDSVVAGD